MKLVDISLFFLSTLSSKDCSPSRSKKNILVCRLCPSFEAGVKAGSELATLQRKKRNQRMGSLWLPLSQSSKAWFETVRGGLHAFAARRCFKLHRS